MAKGSDEKAPRPDRTTWQVSITVEDKEWLRRRAAEEGVTMAGLLHMMIRREQKRVEGAE